MTRSRLTVCWAGVLASVAMIGITPLLAQPPALPKGVESSFDSEEGSVLKVFSAEHEGHRFIAYLVQWKDFEVIVSDPLARSDFQQGDTIQFLAQKVRLPNLSTLNFVLLAAPAEMKRAAADGTDDTASPAERKRMMDLVGGDLDSARNEQERFYALNRAAKKALSAGKTEEARKLAEELLRRAQTQTDDWNYGNAIQDGNQVLGRIALAKGDVTEAKKRLLTSVDSKGSPQMNSFGPNMQLANELLAVGEKQVVLEYFDLCRKFWELGADRLAVWTEAVNKGQRPDFGASLDY
ncbi:hypothetical protein Enr13x_07620 [Stieleria neptunia]|uniref:Tetratricopeptide repeat protein n=1 Tax=Stieleria neptunia TaxID=2527979 RepID=A0A518HJ99_9BACT|nr:hypothetical protein [Stieleria neptunia]QDV40924.1 hypothetical protein Enr13x_07620 [Stieleria neptunia]